MKNHSAAALEVRGLMRGFLASAGFHGGSDTSKQEALVDEYAPRILAAAYSQWKESVDRPALANRLWEAVHFQEMAVSPFNPAYEEKGQEKWLRMADIALYLIEPPKVATNG